MDKYSKISKQDKKSVLRGLGFVTQIAITAAVCVLIGLFLGLFLDRRLGTEPWLVIIFSLLGCAAAFKAMIDIAKKI